VADLALLGIVLTAAVLPVVTAGAAVATASFAVDHWCRNQAWPRPGTLLRMFGRAVLPGLGALAVLGIAALFFAVDVTALRAGRVPGSPVLLVLTVVAGALATGLAALTVVLLGRQPTRGWRWAIRTGWRHTLATPLLPLTLTGVLAMAALLAWMIPVTVPLVAGFALFATHVVARRRGLPDVPVLADGEPMGD
jgi:hypothetical protein